MNKKRFLVTVSALALAFSLSACGSKGDTSKSGSMNSGSKVVEEKKEQDLKTIADRLLTEIKYQDELSQMEDEMFDINYAGFPADKVKDKIIHLSSSGGTAEEVACFEAVDSAAVEDVKKGVEARLTFQRASFANYVPEEVKRIDKAVIEVKGNFVVLCISDEPDKAKDIVAGK